MILRSKKEYVETIYLRYRDASWGKKGLILDEFCATLGCHRKHAIRVLKKFKRFRKTKTQRPGRAPFYSHPQILKPLKKIWLAANLPCSKRLKVILPLWTQGYIQSFGPLRPQTQEALSRISPATIDRILSPTRIHRFQTSTPNLRSLSLTFFNESTGFFNYSINLKGKISKVNILTHNVNIILKK
jgi:hypothetical protein